MIKFVFVLILLPFALIASVPPSNIKLPDRFADYDKGYSIQFPEGWKWQKDFMGLDAFACSVPEPQEQRSEANMSVISVVLPEDFKIEDFFEDSLAVLKQGLSEFQIVETGKVAFNEFQGRMVCYKHRAQHDLQLRVKQYFILQNGLGVIITGSCTLGESYQYLPLFEQYAKTLKFY